MGSLRKTFLVPWMFFCLAAWLLCYEPLACFYFAVFCILIVASWVMLYG